MLFNKMYNLKDLNNQGGFWIGNAWSLIMIGVINNWVSSVVIVKHQRKSKSRRDSSIDTENIGHGKQTNKIEKHNTENLKDEQQHHCYKDGDKLEHYTLYI